MKTYNTLDEIYKDAFPHQVTAQELLNGRSYVLGAWRPIELSDELRKSICHDIAAIFGGQTKTQMRVCRHLMNERRQHWGLVRVVIEQYNNEKTFLGYIAGQHKPSECRDIRNALK